MSQNTSDAAVRKTSFNDIGKAEVRGYKVHRAGLEHVSSNTIYFDCPWCGNEVKAYVWSLCGGVKRCSCGAIFGGFGNGYKLPESSTQSCGSAVQL